MPNTKDSREKHEILHDFLIDYGITVEDEDAEETLIHLEVMLEALRIYCSRNQAYGTIWKQYGALSNLLSMARKVDRVINSWWHGNGKPVLHKDNLDDAIDLINYTVFFIRNARNANIVGTPPKRPHLRRTPRLNDED